MTLDSTELNGNLAGVRVVEIADEQAEYCGLTLAGLGAAVIKIEPPGGSPTRRIGPFVDDIDDPERSLYFWHYNRGKQSVVLDLENDASARERLLQLLEDIGVDNVMFETDFPHPTCLYPSAREHALDVLAPWGEDVQRKVLQDNAAKLYRIKV